MRQESKTQNVTKLKNLKCDKTPKLKIYKTQKLKYNITTKNMKELKKQINL